MECWMSFLIKRAPCHVLTSPCVPAAVVWFRRVLYKYSSFDLITYLVAIRSFKPKTSLAALLQILTWRCLQFILLCGLWFAYDANVWLLFDFQLFMYIFWVWKYYWNSLLFWIYDMAANWCLPGSCIPGMPLGIDSNLIGKVYKNVCALQRFSFST